jgi:hypothetical protein
MTAVLFANLRTEIVGGLGLCGKGEKWSSAAFVKTLPDRRAGAERHAPNGAPFC